MTTSICWSTGSGCGSSTPPCHETTAAEEPDRHGLRLYHPGRLYRAGHPLRKPARRDQGAQGGRLMVLLLAQLLNLTRDPGVGDFFRSEERRVGKACRCRV